MKDSFLHREKKSSSKTRTKSEGPLKKEKATAQSRVLVCSAMQPQMGQPVAQPVAQPAMSKMRVTVPAGVKGGQPLQVQTPSGLMQVLPPSAPQTPLFAPTHRDFRAGAAGHRPSGPHRGPSV